MRTPMPIAQMEQEFPEAYTEFIKVCKMLEDHYHDMQLAASCSRGSAEALAKRCCSL